MSSRLSDKAWYWPPHLRYECASCGASQLLKPDEMPPNECPNCGNRGQNLWPCEGCDKHVSLNGIPDDWEDDVLPGCENGHEGMVHYPVHKYVGPESYYDREKNEPVYGRCEVCGERQGDAIHAPREEEDE